MKKPVDKNPIASPVYSGSSYRSGVAARMAGLPVETLRVWERRYALSDAERSVRGQRLYTAAQINRLRLLKSLVDQGHAIGMIATLSDEQLELLSPTNLPEQMHRAGPIKVALVGQRLRERLAASGSDGLRLDVRSNSATLNEALSVLADTDAEVLVVEVAELDESAVPLIEQARQLAGIRAVVVMYRFCASTTIRQLRMRECLVARVPSDMSELVGLCRIALSGQRLVVKSERSTEPPPPQFNIDVLTTLTTTSNKVECECPRHLAEILLMVGSFERYSAQCASRNADDAQLHQDLARTTGQARSILESAMEQLMRAEGLKY